MEIIVPLQDKPLDSIVEGDLQRLITTKLAEQRTLDHKRELPGSLDQVKVELRADASSFANASGGYLIFGMGARKGIPVDLCGVEADDPDGEILRMESTIKDGVRPRVQGIVSHALTLASGRKVIIIYIPRSWSAPHMTMNTKNWGRFYSRNSAGKYELDIGEIHSSFLRSDTITELIRTFRAEPLAKIVAG